MMTPVIQRLTAAGLPTTDKELWTALERRMPRNHVLFVHPTPKGWIVRLARFEGDCVLDERGQWAGETLLDALAVFAFSKRFYTTAAPATKPVALAGRDGDVIE